jgi:hypothetical protein
MKLGNIKKMKKSEISKTKSQNQIKDNLKNQKIKVIIVNLVKMETIFKTELFRNNQSIIHLLNDVQI